MKRKINNINKMAINKFFSKKNLLKPTKNNDFWKKIEGLFNSKKSFLLILKKFDKSHGIAYKFYYDKVWDLYGNNFHKQGTKRKSAFLALIRILNEKDFDFIIVKKKSTIIDFDNMVKRKDFITIK